MNHRTENPPLGQRDVEALVVKLGMFAAGLNELGERLTHNSQQASSQLARSAQTLASTADTSARNATARLETSASAAITAGTRAATDDMERTLRDASDRLTTTTHALEHRLVSLKRLHAASAWKALLAAAIAAVTAAMAAGALGWQASQRIQEASWLGELTQARHRGALQPCPEGGVCVYIGKRWHRL